SISVRCCSVYYAHVSLPHPARSHRRSRLDPNQLPVATVLTDRGAVVAPVPILKHPFDVRAALAKICRRVRGRSESEMSAATQDGGVRRARAAPYSSRNITNASTYPRR